MVTPCKPLTVFFCLLGLWLGSGVLEAAEIQVRASRDPVVQSESFALIFSTAESPDAEPDFSPLAKEFEILDQGKSSNFQFLNGHKSHSITWRLELMPKRSGEIVIPVISFGKDHSTPLTVNILPAGGQTTRKNRSEQTESGLLVEAEVSNPAPHLLEQLLLTVRFLNAVPIAGASMPDPTLESGDAIIEKLGADQAYERERQGERYLVSERRYALFPQRSGPLVIAAIPVTVQLPGQGGGSNLLKELLNDPFFKNLPLGPGRPGRTIRLATEPIRLETKPQPANWQGAWLPAHRLILEEKWNPDPPRFQVGEPITRTLTLIADGLTSAHLADIPLKNPDGIKLYPDRPLLENQKEHTGIIGKRQEKIALIPTAPGEVTLPAIEIPWWNIDRQQPDTARLPERRVTVLPAPASATGPSSTPAPAPAVNSAVTPPVPAADAPLPAGAEPTRQPAPPVAATTPAPPPPDAATAGIWPWVALALGTGWLGTGLLWWYRMYRQRTIKVTSTPVGKPDETLPVSRETEEALQRACRNHDPVAARTALMALPDWMRSTALVAEMARLNAALYGRTPSSWHGESLWAAYRSVRDAHPRASRMRFPTVPTSPTSPTLPPLYPS
ncbi:MAG: protein BatD [Magnetococcales bacterium]|nr:protein BatD [Magnetococcales bacterium]